MYDTHRHAADQHELAAHAHRTAAEHNEKGKNELGNWHLQRALEYSDRAYKLAKEAHPNSGQIGLLEPLSSHNGNELVYGDHYRAAELHDRAAATHRIVQKNEKDDEMMGDGHAHQALSHSQAADKLTKAVAFGYGVTTFEHDEIAAFAHKLWKSSTAPNLPTPR